METKMEGGRKEDKEGQRTTCRDGRKEEEEGENKRRKTFYMVLYNKAVYEPTSKAIPPTDPTQFLTVIFSMFKC